LAKASASSGFPIEPPQFAELEERVGRRLVERHVGAYRLTELGRELRPATESVESAVAAFERRLAAYDKGLPGALEVADIFCDHGPAWRKTNAGRVSLEQLKVMAAIENRRTAALGRQ
jgi:hypothetical protein